MLGLATMVQALPFQDSINVLENLPLTLEPTAVHEVGETHLVTSFRELLPTLGLATNDHALPFQDSINAWTMGPLEYEPTAVHAVGEVHHPFQLAVVGAVVRARRMTSAAVP
jgi:hypothetical protein